ncbi:very long chain fatty acid elongase 2-like [Atheta coriaria]|uniref:very long chain fatty acid elongase 2-like n=1 Tax=Dalotia coriaria TaxID=877792 RepID=UPI0031F4772C
MWEIFNHAIHPSLQVYLGPPDPLTSSWYLLDTPLAILTILPLYFITISNLNRFMTGRKALELRGILVVYNVLQVLLSAYICKEVLMSAIAARYNLGCTPFNTSGQNGVRMASAFWLFYVSKMFDLLDTVFFVLRKKDNQITFLHMYHHSSMIFNWYLGLLYSPGGQAFFSVLLNSFVHVIMYTYYMLAAIGPRARKYLWWKRYLTQIQLAQFFCVNIHLAVGLYNRCKAPFWLNCFTITYVSTLVILFANFYYQSYKKDRNTTPVIEEIRDRIDVNAGGDYIHNKIL